MKLYIPFNIKPYQDNGSVIMKSSVQYIAVVMNRILPPDWGLSYPKLGALTTQPFGHFQRGEARTKQNIQFYFFILEQ